jgi:hypothetical protein
VMMLLIAVPSQAMASEVQLAQVQQPSKAEVVDTIQLAQRYPEPPKMMMSGDVSPSVSPLDCNLCWTCGGSFPNFGGYFNSPAGTYELGTGCGNTGPQGSGYPKFTNDTFPRLCCHN